MVTKIYNPAGQPKEQLIEQFVVRTQVFERIFADILKGEMKYPEQHYLIQGQRGMGKTTLLLRLKYEIEKTPELNTWLIPVFFNEESYDLTSLSNLWEKLIKYLDEEWNTGGELYNATEAFLDSANYEKQCFDYLQSILQKNEKKLVILFDNFGQLFLDNLKDKEQHRLREILMHCADLRIIGASAVVLEDLHDYSKPFFEFFRIINLKGLTKEETFLLITKLQEHSPQKINLEKNKAKIETLNILSGGVIRTVILIYEVILADEDGTALSDLESVLDRITPLYKHRIEDLPIQQRRIVDIIAKKWDAISAKEISENIRDNGQRIQTKLISAQLQQLEKNNVIVKKPTSTKNNLYQVEERFFNIWYLMRHGDRKDKCRVIWLTKFLELWYEDPASFAHFVQNHISHLKSGKYNPHSAILLTEALSNSDKIDIISLDRLIGETSLILTDEQKKLLPNIKSQKNSEILSHFQNGDYSESIRILETIDEITFDEKLFLAYCYFQIRENDSALKVINSTNAKTEEEIFSLSRLFNSIDMPQESLKILKNYPGNKTSKYYSLLGSSYLHAQNYPFSIENFKKSIKMGNEDDYKKLIDIYIKMGNYTLAEKYVLKAYQIGVNNIWPQVVNTYLSFGKKEKTEKAVSILQHEISISPKNPELYYNLGELYYFNNETEKALKYFTSAHDLYIRKPNFTELTTNNSFLFNATLLLYTHLELFKKEKKEVNRIFSSTKKINFPEEIGLLNTFVMVWNGDYNNSINNLKRYLKHRPLIESRKIQNRIFTNVVLLFLSRGQYHSMYNLFNMEGLDLKEIMKPLYYTIITLLKEEYSNEYIKMGEELKETVNDILKKIEEMALQYP